MSNLTEEIEALRVGLLEKHKNELSRVEFLAEQQAAHHGELVLALEAVLSAHEAGRTKIEKLVGSLPTRLGLAAPQTSLKGLIETTPPFRQKENAKPGYQYELEQALNHHSRFAGSGRPS